MSPASSQDAYQAIRVKAEVLSDAEGEECPHPITYLGIKAEPEVRCVSLSIVGGFYKYRYPSFYELMLQ
jgi:hypothetical protein